MDPPSVMGRKHLSSPNKSRRRFQYLAMRMAALPMSWSSHSKNCSFLRGDTSSGQWSWARQYTSVVVWCRAFICRSRAARRIRSWSDNSDNCDASSCSRPALGSWYTFGAPFNAPPPLISVLLVPNPIPIMPFVMLCTPVRSDCSLSRSWMVRVASSRASSCSVKRLVGRDSSTGTTLVLHVLLSTLLVPSSWDDIEGCAQAAAAAATGAGKLHVLAGGAAPCPAYMMKNE